MALDRVPEPRLAAGGAVQTAGGGPGVSSTAILFAAGLVAGLAQLASPSGIGMGSGYEMMAVARSLAEHGTFANPFCALPTGPTSVEPPLYPLFVGLAIRLLGAHSLLPYGVVIFANIVANAVAVALLPRVSALLFGTAIPGIAGAALAVAASRLMTAWDASFTQLGLVLVAVGAGLLLEKPGRLVLHGAITGAGIGLVSLLNPASALVSIPCVAFLTVRRAGLRGCVRFFPPLLLAAALVNVPWLARNYAVWGHFVVRTNLGMTLYASNNDCARPSLDEVLGQCYDTAHPNTNVHEAKLLRDMGEVEYDRQRTAAALSWMRLHPDRFAWLTRIRAIRFWLPRPSPPAYSAYAAWVITLLSLPGLVWMGFRRLPAALLFLVVFLIYPAAYYVVMSDIRYRVPIVWLSCLCAGYFVASLLPRLQIKVFQRAPALRP